MINALPSDKHSTNGSGTPMPPSGAAPTLGSPTAPPVTPTSGAVTPGIQPHGNVSNLSQGLSAKIHSGDPTGAPGNIGGATPPPSQPDKAMDPAFNPKKAPFKFKAKNLVAALILGLVVVGGGTGYYLTQQNQDIRQEAASEEVTGTETSRTPADWSIFNQTWQTYLDNPSYTWTDHVTQSQSGGARYQCDAPIMTVGEETLYGCDLNALFILYEPEAYIQPAAIGPQDPALNTVLDALITNSGLLQEAQKRGLITLDESIYNSPNKDSIRRIDTLRQLRETIGNSFNKTVNYEAVTIYFHNQIDPQIPLADAQTAAKAKMDNLYARLQSGEITMEQAGAEIAADTIKGDTTGISLSQLDRLYKENAYSLRESHNFDSEFFTDPSLNEELRSLGEGQMSTVRLCKDSKFTDAEFYAALESQQIPEWPVVDSCYIIFKLNKINFGWTSENSTTNSGETFLKQEYSSQTDKMTENFKQ
ncbi:MAG: hypothetical protein QG639_385 [Patescibacteria group bacterium]|nr:hypothetical protein [Patescibacteria group bacterium]